MKTKLTALSLFIVTALTIGFYPLAKSVHNVDPVVKHQTQIPNEKPKVEVVFVLDTTGSMGGMIETAKEKIWSIASTMASAQPAPEIKIGLVAYRDRGDAYVTKVIDLSEDLDSMYATLMDFRADGGGDGPESVNKGLYDAVNNISWSQDSNSYKAIFLVGDAQPHMYQDEVQYPETLKLASNKGIIVNTIQCGQDRSTTREWQQIASLADGNYFQVEQAGGAVAVTTPFDDKLAALSRELDDTRLYYGNMAEQAKQKLKVSAAEKLHKASSIASRARRAAFNIADGGEGNFLGNKELVDAVATGKVDLASIDEEELPASIQAMAPEEQLAEIKVRAEKRRQLKEEIGRLAQERKDYIKKEVEAMEDTDESFDYQLFDALKAQASEKGIEYEADAPAL